ncbi:putative cytochrome P450 [Helianthus anomalus]
MPIHQFRRKPNKSGKNPLCENRTQDLMVTKFYPTTQMPLGYNAMDIPQYIVGVGNPSVKSLPTHFVFLHDPSPLTVQSFTKTRYEVDFMIAGTETTATLIEWAMANIMGNHKVMKKIQEELVEIVGLNNMVEESHLPKLQYLDATIKETFRLNPIVPFLIPRAPSKDCVVGGYTIPKGCSIFLNVISIHRNPQCWDNPLEFKPERFLANKGTNKWDYNGNDLKFFPFGSGRRLCPGIPLAQKMQMFILASLLHSFDWSLPNGEEHDLSESFGLTLTKRKPLIAIPYQRLPDASLYM